MDQPIKPSEIRLSKDKKLLTVTFSDQAVFEFEAELLRVRSPSAEVQGHSPDQRILVSGKKNVGIMKMHPIGNYAVRIEFDDMHNTGIFTWEFLYGLGLKKDEEWATYEAELSDAGMNR